jgi:CheY-like chemotaxis protein
MLAGSSSPDRQAFSNWVHEALNRLYDSPYLQTHPLAALLRVDEADAPPRRSQTLRRVLLEAIESMRPTAGVPAQSPDWRAYRILELRYIEGLSPNEAMERLALGKSQFFRDQARVVEALNDLLWERWQKSAADASTLPDRDRKVHGELVQAETERLCAQATWEAVDASDLLRDLASVVEPLAHLKDAVVVFEPLPHLTVLRADRVMLRQALLGIVTYALELARGGRVEVKGFRRGQETGLLVSAHPGAAVPASLADGGSGLEISSQLMEAMKGRLKIEAGDRSCWQACLAWPLAEPCLLLVVDDNTAFTDLFRRYLAGQNWRVIGAVSGAEARRMVAAERPTVVILDVMMPKEDGWDLLISLQSSAETRDVPVIVCSVLVEPQLAASLGAKGYLTKPVAQPALLRALAPWSRSGASLEPAR